MTARPVFTAADEAAVNGLAAAYAAPLATPLALPLPLAAALPGRLAAELPSHTASTGMSASRARILVVDDDAGARRLTRATLTKAGFGVVEAPDGQRALELLRQELPDLV